MEYSESFYPKKAVDFKIEKVVSEFMELINTYCVKSFYKLSSVQDVIKSNKYGSWNQNNILLMMDFRQVNCIKLEIECTEFSLVYEYERNEFFENGRHHIRVDTEQGDVVFKAFLGFIDKMNSGALVDQQVNPGEQENGKKYVIIDLHYHEQNSRGDICGFDVTDAGISWGISGPPQITMSAVGGTGGTLTFEEFINGKCQDFVLENFGKKVLDEVKKNVSLRLSKKNQPH